MIDTLNDGSDRDNLQPERRTRRYRLYHKYWSPGTGWGPSVTGSERLGCVIVADPVEVSWASQRLDIFVIGTDLALYHKYWSPSTGWGPSVTGYERLGGVILGAPAAVSWAPQRLDIFVV